MKMAFPNWNGSYFERMLRRVYDHFGQMFVDVLRMKSMDIETLVDVEDRHILDIALENGKGAIVLSGHLGNWELGGPWFGHNGYKFHPVVKRQKNRGADRFITELRRCIGTYPIYDRTSVHEMIQIIREGKVLCLVSDQDARRRGVFVQFFGTPTSTPKGAVILHLKTGAPLIFAICYRKRDGTYHLKFERVPTDVQDGDVVTTITQRFTSLLESKIRKHPEQYFWFHRRWKTKPSPGRVENV